MNRHLCIAAVLCWTACSGNDEPILGTLDQEAVTSVANDWLWIDTPTSRCRDGSSTGFGLRLTVGATRTLVFFQGGGGCWDATSCAENAASPVAGSSYDVNDFAGWATVVGAQGIFNRARADNPYGIYHHVYIPYCTGDFHGGTRTDVVIPGVTGTQDFVGRANVDAFLDDLGPLLASQDAVTVSGSSAGGFGATLNFDKIAAASGSAAMTLLVDASPVVAHMPACFQDTIRSTFGLALPPQCSVCTDPAQGGLANLYPYLAATYPTARMGVDSALFDAVLTLVLGRESTVCGGPSITAIDFFVWLAFLRDYLLAPSGISSFLWLGGEHTALSSDPLFYAEGVGATTLTSGWRPADWATAVEAGSTLHVQP